MSHEQQEELLADLFSAAVKAVVPYNLIKSFRNKIHRTYKAGNFHRLFVVGFGKAAFPMAEGMEDSLGEIISNGIVITKYGHCPAGNALKKIEVHEAGHPVPDENGAKGTEAIIRLLRNLDEQTLVACLISGGGSSLLVSPGEGIELEAKKQVTELLLRQGANIVELNTVRKHLSRVKGGRLAEIACPGTLISLILSDVIGDRLDVIASGPTAPDKTTYHDAMQVLEKYRLNERVPKEVSEFLTKGSRELIPETPKPGSKVFERVKNIVVGNNKVALMAAKAQAEAAGMRTQILSSRLSGEAQEVGTLLARKAREVQSSVFKDSTVPVCLISGGETTVTVRGQGLGGRNMELALSFARAINNIPGIILLSAGTDGTDGPTDAAGAIVDGETVVSAKAKGLNPEDYLEDNDSYHFFRALGGLFAPGPTGTNVMDLQIIIISL